jgi:hypothetical protein
MSLNILKLRKVKHWSLRTASAKQLSLLTDWWGHLLPIPTPPHNIQCRSLPHKTVKLHSLGPKANLYLVTGKPILIKSRLPRKPGTRPLARARQEWGLGGQAQATFYYRRITVGIGDNRYCSRNATFNHFFSTPFLNILILQV